VQGPFVKGLTQELWTGPTTMDPVLFSAAFDNRRDAAITLHFVSRSLAVVIRPKGGDQAQCQSRPGPWERVENKKIRMRLRELLDLSIEKSEGLSQRLQDSHQRHRCRRRGQDDCLVVCGGHGLPDLFHSLLYLFRLRLL
jgi:hypothetical protein